MPGPFGGPNLLDIIGSRFGVPNAELEEQKRQEMLRRIMQTPLGGQPGPQPIAPLVQGQNEWDPVFAARQALAKPFEWANAALDPSTYSSAFSPEGTAKQQAFTQKLTSTPAKRAAAAEQQPQAFGGGSQGSQPSQPSQQPQLGLAGWNPFQGAVTVAGGEPGAPRDGGRRAHAGRDYAGMKVGTSIFAPPGGAQLVKAGSDNTSGNWGKWRLADGSVMSVAHLASQPNQDTVGPGQPLAFLGNSGNASNAGTNRATAHVRLWGKDGKEMDPQAFFGGGGGGPQVGPNQTRMEGAIAAAGGIPQIPGADYSGVDKHLQLQQQALENVQKPFEFTYKPPEYPDRPAPEQLQDVNYASSDAAFAAGAPKNPFGGSPEEQEKQKLKMRRASYWAGLGQAFASFKDGQGLGSLLANAGGAMLSGAMQGDENVRAKMEAFDKSMSQYKLAESSRDQTKATNTANLVNQNIQNNNQHAALKWADEMKEQQKLDVQFTPDGRAMVGEKLPDGQIRYKSTMINPAAVNGILDQIGATHERRSAITNRQQELEYEGELSTFKMLLPAAYADAMQQGDVKTAAEAQMLAAHVAAFEITDGNTWRQVVEALPNGKATAAKMNYDAWQSVGVMADEETGDPVFGQSPTSEQTKGYRNFIQNNLVQTFMETGNIHRLIGGPTREVYTDQPGMPGTGVHSYKAPDSGVTGAIYGNAVRDRQVSRRSTTKLPFGGSESTTVKE